MSAAEERARLCQAARSHLGTREGDGDYLAMVERYNAIRPLPRGYRLRPGDPWCAAFVSALGAECGLEEVLLPECSCEAMIRLYRQAGRWEERDDFLPSPGDLVFYDWQDDGLGDCAGAADHVGLVLSVRDGRMEVAEGNLSHAVGLRSIGLNARFLRGFARPDYGGEPGTDPAPAAGETGTVPGLPLLRSGSRGETVRAAQLLLIGRGFPCGPEGADGDFGPRTREAVLRFQGSRGLEADGLVGERTWSALLGI